MRVLEDLGCDMILGCDWCNLCSHVEFDFPKTTISVFFNEVQLKLQAVSANSGQCSFITGPELFHMTTTELDSEVEEVFVPSIVPKADESMIGLDRLLEQYKDIFEEPTELPPTRGIEHHIILKPDSIPKQQYPYRTSHSHKDEI